VAARSYTLAESRYRYEAGVTSPEGDTLYARTCDTTACHVYGGRAVRQGGTVTSREHPNTDRAIRETAGEIRVDGSGNPVYAMYSSSTGGHTAGGRFTPVPDDGDDVAGNPNHRWTTTLPVSTIEGRYDRGALQGIAVIGRNGLGDDGGRVTRVRLSFSGGTVELTGNEFRRAFGLKSDWFTPLGVPAGTGCPAAGLGGLDRLYSAYFERDPDLTGFAYWTERLRAGQSLVSISQAFTGSEEFESDYGEAISNRDFVRLVYRNVMEREGEASGVAYWTDILDRGVRGKGSVMALFSESAEYKAKTGNCP
jgi:SpoIID/LytB domain protein